MLFLSERTPAGRAAAAPGRRAVAAWLFACCGLTFAMVVLGGVTRLTGSGLSMVEWRPLMGAIPPLSEAQWLAAFERYREFPEYRIVNRGLDLDGFKTIFLIEYAHRLLGRVLAVAFLAPLAWFWLRGRLTRALKPHLVALFALGGAQGLLGWYMVQSGLVGDPHVSQYRLAAHLCLAALIYGYMLFVASELRAEDDVAFLRGRGATLPGLMVALIFLMIASGGLVAGVNAGSIYNTFPDMNGQLVPDGLAALRPAWRNAFENPVTIQFNHRALAWLILLATAVHALRAARRGPPPLRFTAILLFAVVAAQFAIGILTLLHGVPAALGVLHQAGALAVFTVAVLHYRGSRHARASLERGGRG